MRISNNLVCIASGPSLVDEDCEKVRNFPDTKILVVNDSWRMAPFADYLYGGDMKWWRAYHAAVKNFLGEKWTCSHNARDAYHVNYHRAGGSYNSGMRAIQFGIMKGFKNIILLGYDCSLKHGIHWHGPHTFKNSKNPNPTKLIRWRAQFEKAATQAANAGVKVINCSRHTELSCFVRMDLEDALDFLRRDKRA